MTRLVTHTACFLATVHLLSPPVIAKRLSMTYMVDGEGPVHRLSSGSKLNATKSDQEKKNESSLVEQMGNVSPTQSEISEASIRKEHDSLLQEDIAHQALSQQHVASINGAHSETGMLKTFIEQQSRRMRERVQTSDSKTLVYVICISVAVLLAVTVPFMVCREQTTNEEDHLKTQPALRSTTTTLRQDDHVKKNPGLVDLKFVPDGDHEKELLEEQEHFRMADHHHKLKGVVDSIIASSILKKTMGREAKELLKQKVPVQARHSEWLTADECTSFGLPPLGTMLRSYFKRAPWAWDEPIDGWVVMSFPWDPLQLQKMIGEKGITARADGSDSMPSQLVEQFVNGRCIWSLKNPSEGERSALERVTPLLCIRVFDSEGRCLVRVSRTVRDEKTGDLKSDDRWQWPGRACAEPDDVIEETQKILAAQAGMPPDAATFVSGEAQLSEPRNCRMLTVTVRFFRHFVNAHLKKTIDPALTTKLGLDTGKFTTEPDKDGETYTYAWVPHSKCDSELPGNAGEAFSQWSSNPQPSTASRASTASPSTSTTAGPLDFALATPWTVDAVERALRKLKVNTNGIKNLREGFAQSFLSGNSMMVHNLRADEQKETDVPSVALIRKDGSAFFFPPRRGSARQLA